MIVDATALPEQVTDDVIASAFRSAGQRCSALRLLCLQEDVADTMIAMIAGAARELAIGDPRDIGNPYWPGDRRRRQASLSPFEAIAASRKSGAALHYRRRNPANGAGKGAIMSRRIFSNSRKAADLDNPRYSGRFSMSCALRRPNSTACSMRSKPMASG